jgi:superfamily II helicase
MDKNEVKEYMDTHVHEWQLYRMKQVKGKPATVIAVCKICLARKEVSLVPNEQID